jgi:cyclophilin family peptidyl-prolyl cis-trans isomerase
MLIPPTPHYRAAVPSDKRQRQRENAAAKAMALRAAQQRRANRRKFIVVGGAIVLIVGIIALIVVQTTGSTKKPAAAPTTTAAPATTAVSAPVTVATTPTTQAVGTPPVPPPDPAGATIKGVTPCPAANGSSPRTTTFAQAPPACIDPGKTYTATFDTTQGTVVVALDTKDTAGTVNNFVVLSRYHYYDGSALFRLDQSIDIIQGGAPTTQSASDPGPGYKINDEGHFTTDSSGSLHGPYTYAAGDLVMARGAGPKSAAAQFFFVTGSAASALDSQGTYVVFGHVTQGLSILQNILQNEYAACPSTDAACGDGQLGGVPKVPVIIKSLTISEQ